MTIDERIEALTARHEVLAQSMERTRRDIQDFLKATTQNAENICALARIAEIRKRLSYLQDKH